MFWPENLWKTPTHEPSQMSPFLGLAKKQKKQICSFRQIIKNWSRGNRPDIGPTPANKNDFSATVSSQKSVGVPKS